MAFINCVPLSTKSTFTSSSSACTAISASDGYRRRNARINKVRKSTLPTMDLPAAGIYDKATKPAQVRVVIFGATGYIGRFVTLEFIRCGYEVVAFARERSGIGARNTRETVTADFKGATVVFGDVTKSEDVAKAFEYKKNEKEDIISTVVVSCLASRSGGIKDSNDIDYEATLNTLVQGRLHGNLSHFILLSAICVQKPELGFQKAKLKLESMLTEESEKDSSFSYSIVRPTAFFKSLAAQIERMKNGSAFIMFGDGDLSKCNALSEKDLASFMVECATDDAKRNQILPVGGPGQPVTPKQQAELLFKILDKKPKYVRLPIAIMDFSIALLDGIAKVLPFAKETVEFARIGRYYAVEDMVGPQYGTDTLEQFFENAIQPGGLDGQDLGDASIF